MAADVAALLAEGGDPYRVARSRERSALDEREARHWNRVAVGIAKKTGRRIGLDVATRMQSGEQGD